MSDSPVRSSVNTIVRPFNKKADSLKRSANVSYDQFVVENVLSLGKKVTEVPEPRRLVFSFLTVPTGSPPFLNDCLYKVPSRNTSTVNQSDNALTTDAPTP